MWEQVGSGNAGAAQTLAWLGPCIGPEAFEVGPEVRAAFIERDADSAQYFVPQGHGKFLADLAELARRRLAAMGVTQVYGNDGSAAWCTVSNPSRFFSHRRDRVSGRLAAGIWLA
jgi:copper oxidase (laccase) domain-containing protein